MIRLYRPGWVLMMILTPVIAIGQTTEEEEDLPVYTSGEVSVTGQRM